MEAKISWVSSCCKDRAYVDGNTTMYYVCNRCGQPCDVVKQVKTLEEVIEDVMESNIPYTWKNKVKPGLFYRTVTDVEVGPPLIVDGGQGYALDVGNKLEEQLLPNSYIEETIQVYFNQEWVPLNQITVENYGKSDNTNS